MADSMCMVWHGDHQGTFWEETLARAVYSQFAYCIMTKVTRDGTGNGVFGLGRWMVNVD